MNILLLDKFFLSAENYLRPWMNALRTQGHTVNYESRLRNLAARGLSLSHYDLAVVHPDERDYAQLFKELTAQQTLRVILHSGNDPREFVDIANSPRCYYAQQAPTPEKLIDLVEKGWAGKQSL